MLLPVSFYFCAFFVFFNPRTYTSRDVPGLLRPFNLCAYVCAHEYSAGAAGADAVATI